ncbi:exonuclease domain-containing protein, partial [Vibrio rotiferianus]
MRVVIIDVETTGLNVAKDDRVVEIGAVEIVDGKITDNHFQAYINPHRKSEPEAFKLHGLSEEFLSNKPDFIDIVDKFIEFVDGADELSFYNRNFDKSAIRTEFTRCGMKARFQAINKLDSSCLWQELKTEYKTSNKIRMTLDYACMLFGISLEEREEEGHGALLDAYLTAELYVRYKVLNQVASIPKKKVSDKKKQPKPRKKAPKYIQTLRPI